MTVHPENFDYSQVRSLLDPLWRSAFSFDTSESEGSSRSKHLSTLTNLLEEKGSLLNPRSSANEHLLHQHFLVALSIVKRKRVPPDALTRLEERISASIHSDKENGTAAASLLLLGLSHLVNISSPLFQTQAERTTGESKVGLRDSIEHAARAFSHCESISRKTGDRSNRSTVAFMFRLACGILAHAILEEGDCGEEELKRSEEDLQMTLSQVDLVSSPLWELNHLAAVGWCHIGNTRAALLHFEKCLTKLQLSAGTSTKQPHLARLLTNLSCTFRRCNMGEEESKVSFQLLKILQASFGKIELISIVSPGRIVLRSHDVLSCIVSSLIRNQHSQDALDVLNEFNSSSHGVTSLSESSLSTFAQAFALIETNNSAKALPLIEQLVHQNRDPSVLLLQADALAYQCSFDAALQVLEEVISSPFIESKDPLALVKAMINKAIVLLQISAGDMTALTRSASLLEDAQTLFNRTSLTEPRVRMDLAYNLSVIYLARHKPFHACDVWLSSYRKLFCWRTLSVRDIGSVRSALVKARGDLVAILSETPSPSGAASSRDLISLDIETLEIVLSHLVSPQLTD